ncbi:MAG: endo alpha-1,4 polygalactosaminidase [Gemmatimonadales bacterium]
MKACGAAAAVIVLAGCTASPVPGPWVPEQGAAWHLQLSGTPATTAGVAVYDVDGADTSAVAVEHLKSGGARVICYLNGGAREEWRADAGRFPGSVIGEPLEDWPGERWIDIRQLDVVLPIMEDRIADCAAKGFDAVDPDNVDGFLHDTGFGLLPEDAASYVTELARLAHEHGLTIGLKNAVELLPRVGGTVDFAVNEECQQWGECNRYDEFVASGKAVFNVEYTESCSTPAGFSSIRGRVELDGPTAPCPS